MRNIHLSQLYETLTSGDPVAAEQLFKTYEPYLRMVVRRQLSPRLRSKFDSMDVVQSVWADVVNGSRSSRWHFEDADHLRAFLVKLTRDRFIDFCRHHRTPLERERPLNQSDSQEMPASREDRPSQIAQANELWERMLRICPPAHRPLLELKSQGLPLAEIAARVGLHEGSVRRILAELARRYDALKETDT